MNFAASGWLQHSKCDDCAIHNRSICGAENAIAAQELERISRTRLVPAGQTIISENSEIAFVGNVVKGVLKLSKTLEDGRQQIVGLLFPSDFFGRIYQERSQFSFEAASDVEICVFDRAAFEALLARHPDVEHEILLQILDELDAVREWLVVLGCQNAEEKVAGFLLMLLRRTAYRGCSRGDYGAKTIVQFPINRKDIAMFLGTTLETISRKLQQMSREGVLRIIDGQHFEILDAERLSKIAGHDEWLRDHTAQLDRTV